MSEQLSTFRIKRGRRVFDFFCATNSFSFALISGNTITLYALSLGASSTVVGLLSAFMYLSFFAIPLGKIGVRRTSLIKTYGNNWIFRTCALIPLLLIPYLSAIGQYTGALGVLLFSVFFFNFFRGIGLIANNPVIATLSPGTDRGEYIVRISLINNATGLLATLFLAFLLWKHAGLQTYNLVVLIGIATGLVSSFLIFKLPEPAKESDPAEKSSGTFFSRFFEAIRERNFRVFIISYLIIGLGIGMVRPFIIVYCKEVYGQPDSIVTIFTVCSIIGALFMGSILRLVIDRLGSKPLYIIFATISLLSLLPALISPGIGTVVFPVIFLCLFSAVTNMGFAGQENAAQTYFFAMVSKEALMDLSMLYFFILGATGAIGSVLGGVFLDFLASSGFSSLASFRLFFLVSVALFSFGILIQRKLLDLGSYRVRDTIAILFSPRDMRALTLLHKLDANQDPEEETGIIAELGEVASSVSAEGLIAHLSSPRFAVRYEALLSVSTLEKLNVKTRDALFFELRNGEFSTAALAARLLGQFGVQQALPELRKALESSDYRLVGESMFALARLRDERGQFKISDLLLSTSNPFLLIRGVQSMEEYGTPASIPLLLDLLRNETLPAHVAEEILLALSCLMGMQKKFYYAFEIYVRDRKKARSIIQDTLDEYVSLRKIKDSSIKDIFLSFLHDATFDAPFVDWALSFGKKHTGVYSAMLISVALDAEVNRQEAFRFFLCFWAASFLENPKLIEK